MISSIGEKSKPTGSAPFNWFPTIRQLLGKVLLVDADSIIKRHTDVLNPEAGWLIWKFIQSAEQRRGD